MEYEVWSSKRGVTAFMYMWNDNIEADWLKSDNFKN